MFYCLLLNQYVCIHKLGKISEIDHIVATKKRYELSINNTTLQGCVVLVKLGSPFVICFLALRPII